MSRIASFRPSGAMVVACLALFVALGGGAYAATKLKPNSVKSKTVKDNSLTGNDINEATLNGAAIPGIPTGGGGADGAGTGAAGGDLAGNYPNPTIKALAVTGAKIANGAVNTTQLADNAVTNPKMADNSVDSAEIAGSAVKNPEIALDAITSGEVDDDSLGKNDMHPSARLFANSTSKTSSTTLTNTDAGVLTAHFGVGGLNVLPVDESNYIYLINAEVVVQEVNAAATVQVTCTLTGVFGATPNSTSVGVDLDPGESATLPLVGMMTDSGAGNSATGGSVQCRKSGGTGTASVLFGEGTILAIPTQ